MDKLRVTDSCFYSTISRVVPTSPTLSAHNFQPNVIFVLESKIPVARNAFTKHYEYFLKKQVPDEIQDLMVDRGMSCFAIILIEK